MPRPVKGTRTPGSGRKKGTPNSSTRKAQEIADKLKCDPFEILLRFAMGDWEGLGYESGTEIRATMAGTTYEVPVIPPGMRKDAASDAAQYLVPKRKAIEHSVDDDTQIAATIIYHAKWGETAEPSDGNANPDEDN